jgi:energy-coupling factor transporter ATP-binding protein EcfA2
MGNVINRPIAETRKLTYTHAGDDTPSLRGLDLEFAPGEFVVIIGASGCGKSTLLRCLAGISPHMTPGDMDGSVLINGTDSREQELYEIAQSVGYVGQNPADQIFSLTAEDEVAFGPENLGLSRSEIADRVHASLEMVGLTDRAQALTLTMSGGEKQRLVIASCLALRPQMLLFDEPTTDLDPETKETVIAAIDQLRSAGNLTIVIAEHAIGDIVQHADRVIVMSDGGVVLDDRPEVVLGQNARMLQSLGLRMPGHVRAAQLLQSAGCDLGAFPVTPAALASSIDSAVADGRLRPASPAPTEQVPATHPATPLIQASDVWYRHTKDKWQARGLNATVRPGEYIAVLGRNGVGKSTFGKLLIGLLNHERGSVITAGMDTKKASVAAICRRVGYLFQNPAHQLFTGRVIDEVLFGLRISGIEGDEAMRRARETLEFVGLDHKDEQHPLKLSQGERKRLAAGTVLALRPDGMILDEPTTGQDHRRLTHLLRLMDTVNRESSTAIVMITHDMDVVSSYATRVIGLSSGAVDFDGSPAQLFADAAAMQRLGVRPPEVVQVANNVKSLDLGTPNSPEDLVGQLVGHSLVVEATEPALELNQHRTSAR